MKKIFLTALLATLGAATMARAQVSAANNDLILGFRAAGGQGQNVNLEVNLGSVTQFLNQPAGTTLLITRLSSADLVAIYGTNWALRTDLSWGIIGTTGRISAGAGGAPVGTLWATRAEETPGTQSLPWTPAGLGGQFSASSQIETLLVGAPGSLNGATPTTNSTSSAAINATLAGSYTYQDTLQSGTSFSFFNPSIDNGVKPSSGSYAVSDLYEVRVGASSATYLGSFGLSATGTLTFSTSASYFASSSGTPVVTTQPTTNNSAGVGGSVTLTAAASGSPTFQWQQNGANVAGATSATLNLTNVQSANAGVYVATATNSSGTTTTKPAIVGVTTTSKVIGAGTELQANIVHPNGNTFDQILLTGAASTFTADGGQVTRASYIDLNDDIVQIEFSGAGTLSVVLDGASGPAAPVNYNQPSVSYMKGHAGIVVTGANETTNLSVFTVGRATAFDPTGAYNILLAPNTTTNNPANNGSSLFTGKSAVAYDGVADIAFVAISTTNGKFGGLRTSNTSYWSTKGITGVYAPGVEFTGPVFVGDINAMTSATPYLLIGKADVEVRITGGDLTQDNARAVQIDGFTQLHFKDGTKSTGATLTAQANKAQLVQNGVDVTSSVALAPGL